VQKKLKSIDSRETEQELTSGENEEKFIAEETEQELASRETEKHLLEKKLKRIYIRRTEQELTSRESEYFPDFISWFFPFVPGSLLVTALRLAATACFSGTLNSGTQHLCNHRIAVTAQTREVVYLV
jgi:hypothetical protein